MAFFRTYRFTLSAAVFYLFISIWLIWRDQAYLCLFPLGLMAFYFAIYETERTFLALAFFTPLSINIEEWTQSLGLFVPTEPILLILTLLVLVMQLRKGIIPPFVWKHPIVMSVMAFLTWALITTITSSHPVVSIKFVLSRMWFVIPIFLLGPYVFRKKVNIHAFIWLFGAGMVIAMTYTLVMHAGYRFGERESHWVMWPFFKDHTIYGAIVALVIPLLFGVFFAKKHPPLIQTVAIGFILISLLALYFSYTRAAWISILVAIGVWGLVKFKVKMTLIAPLALVFGTILFFSWNAFQMELERNKYEHTTEEFGERLQSATNVSTDASNLERINRWNCAIDMFKERPLFGFGPGTYAFEYARFQRPENLTIISTNFGDLGNVHSEYLGPLAEMGLPGMLLILVVVSTLFYKTITLYHRWPREDQEMRTLLMAIILSLTTYFVHGFLNNFLDTDKAAVPIWGMCAMVIALERSGSIGNLKI
jgi:putative inorganic carbon (HCO3(-)) transporter